MKCRSRPTSFMEGIIERSESPSKENSRSIHSIEKSTLSIHLQDAHLINTRMLMLDGSMMEYKTTTNFEPSPHYSRTHSMIGKYFNFFSHTQLITNFLPDHSPITPSDPQNNNTHSSTFGKTIDPKALHIWISTSESRPHSRQSQRSQSSLRSTSLSNGASRRLSENLPSPSPSPSQGWRSIVNSVLRLSLTESQISSTMGSMPSWRSSDISMYGNSMRSKISNASLSYQDLHLTSGSRSPSVPRVPSILTKEELDIWKELIEEDKTLPPPSILNRIPSYSMVTPRFRECCPPINKLYLECGECGFSQDHFIAVAGIAAPTTGNLNRRDKFGNNALHYAAASANATIHQLMSYIQRGADIRAVNVLGQTFLHIFNSRRLPAGSFAVDSHTYHGLLEKLSDMKFPFQHRDFHGQTIAHLAFHDWSRFDGSQMCTDEGFELALQIMATDTSSCDNQGRRLRDRIAPVGSLVGFKDSFVLSEKNVDEICTRLSDYSNEDLSFRQEISREGWDAQQWISSLAISGTISWVDIHGDTPLTAILKVWNNDDTELDLKKVVIRLLEAGVELNMRDRRGHTALAIATLRGSRPCVQTLLQWRAKPNSRNYQGKSIMEQVSSRLRMAKKKQKDDIYARLLSCILLLKDKGAVMHPDNTEEWQLPPRQIGNDD